MAHPTQEVLHEGDDAPDFFMTGEDEKWIEETTEYMESKYDLSGAFAERDFIGGPPVLDQINEFVYTCKKTIIEFHKASEWRNYTARMVIQRMFVESLENSKHRLIIVIRDNEAENKVPPFLACHFRLKSSEPDFHWKLYNSIKGVSLSNRKRPEKQSATRQEEDPFTNQNNGMHTVLLPNEPGNKLGYQEIRKDHDRFIPESHSHDPLEQEPGNHTTQQFPSRGSESFPGDTEGEQPRDRFLSEDIDGMFSPLQPENVDPTSRNSETVHECVEDTSRKEEIPADGRSDQTTDDEITQLNSGQNQLQEDISQSNGNPDEQAPDSTDTGIHISSGLVSIDLSSECSDTESTQMTQLSHNHHVNNGHGDNPVKVVGEPLMKQLQDYEASLTSLDAADQTMATMSPSEFREHQKAMSNLGRDGQDLICRILKACATTAGLQLDSSVEYNMSHFREYLQSKKYISPSLDQKLKKLKLDGQGNSTMSETVIQVSNNVIAKLCIIDLKKLIQKTFDIKS